MPKRGQTYINEYSRQTSFREKVQQLKQYKGEHLSTFLDEVKCSNDVNQMKRYIESGGTTRITTCGSLFNYENSRFKIYKLQLLNSGNPNFVPLSQYFHPYLNKILELHNDYFNKNKQVMKQFQLLAPEHWRSSTFPQEESDIVSLGKTLGVPDADKLKTEWGKFKYNAMKHELYCGSEQELRTKPEIFFASLLNSKTFHVNPIVRNFLHHVMVIPTGE